MAAAKDKRLSLLGAAIRIELNRPWLMAMANGDRLACDAQIRKELEAHRAAHAGKEPLL